MGGIICNFTILHTMSISVRHITKFYGRQCALEDVSFEVKKGQVTGFLGPNGAGKSTMMKILSCFIPQTSGEAFVCGYDVQEQSMAVKKLLGYLPENNPLYTDLYVKEYLGFVAGVYCLKQSAAAVSRVIEMTGLGPEQHKKIGALSRGYRQRVGLAQALIHDPQVLILDEPTSGLDPNQLEEIRRLIKETGKEKTVLLSTHIMQEVSAICSRVIIINKGKIVADENPRVLQEMSRDTNTVLAEFDKTVREEKIMQIGGVQSAENLGGNKWRIRWSSSKDLRAEIFRFAVEQQLTVLGMQKEEQSLEMVFRNLTKEPAGKE